MSISPGYPDYQIIAQAGTPPKIQLPSRDKKFPNIHKFPLLKTWSDLQEKPDKSAQDVTNELDSLVQFCSENKPTKTIAESDNEAKAFIYDDGFYLPSDERIRVVRKTPDPGAPDMGEKYEVYKYRLMPVLVEKTPGKKSVEKKYVHVATTSYEIYPDNPEKPDMKNCKIIKSYEELIYKKADGKDYYVPDKFKIGDKYYSKVTDPKIKVINIKDGKVSFLNIEEEISSRENEALERVYPTPSEEAKGKKTRARATIRRTKARTDPKKLYKSDPMIKYRGFPMRSSMIKRFEDLEQVAKDLGYNIQLCSTTGGRHISWQHPAGYAIDIVFWKPKIGKNGKVTGRTYLSKRETVKDPETGKHINTSLYIEQKMTQTNKDKNLGMLVYNEYVRGSKYKTGDHFHLARVDFKDMAKDLKDAVAETGSKAVMPENEMAMELVNDALILNGYDPADIDTAAMEEMRQTAESQIHIEPQFKATPAVQRK